MQGANSIIKSIWSVPKKPLAPGAWLWWFWLFFIHDENTKKTGKCRQIMILWSVKNDPDIKCNSLSITGAKNIVPNGENSILDGAAAAWYFDREKMHDDIVLERSEMLLDAHNCSLTAPGKTPSSFYLENGNFITKIKTRDIEFNLVSKKTDPHEAVGPVYGRLPIGPFEIEGTRLEILELSGTEKREGGKSTPIRGTSYFQKILLAAPPPQWYWGLYHFQDGSFATYMNVYIGRAALSANLFGEPNLKKPMLGFKEDIYVYHAPSKRFFEGHKLNVVPSKSTAPGCWEHSFTGGGEGFTVEGEAEGYAHSCWTFVKNIGVLPAKSTFKYNEYPSVLKKLQLNLSTGEKIILENGWGNMENSWGFII